MSTFSSTFVDICAGVALLAVSLVACIGIIIAFKDIDNDDDDEL